MRNVPVFSMPPLQELLAAAQGALPVTIYFSTLLAISYTARRGIPIPVSIIASVLLGLGCTLLISFSINVLHRLPETPVSEPEVSLGEPGLIFSQPHRTLIFLGKPDNHQSPRVISIPDTPLIYQPNPIEQHPEEDASKSMEEAGFYPALVQSNMFFILNTILQDFDFAARQFKSRFQEGFITFGIYVFGLIFLLSSLRFIMDMSSWPLANLFIGILAFRGILFLARLLDSETIQRFLTSFIGDRFSSRLFSPLVFCTLGIILILYTALTHLRKSRRTAVDEEDF
jgi:hypothetical protein